MHPSTPDDEILRALGSNDAGIPELEVGEPHAASRE
jgi:hypothetical protein